MIRGEHYILDGVLIMFEEEYFEGYSSMITYWHRGEANRTISIPNKELEKAIHITKEVADILKGV